VLYIGTCGYAYKDWIGGFYPATIRSSEMLPYYAGCFTAVEIDSTYYGVPQPTTLERMAARTPPGFRFTFKLPQTATHPANNVYGRLHDDVRLLLEVLEPMQRAGKMAALLAQFPNQFEPGPNAQRYLDQLADALRGYPVVAEFRHRDWQKKQYLKAVRELGFGWCNPDMPALPELLEPRADVTSDIGYVRFHGRNAATWRTGDNVTRYQYEYRRDDLNAWVKNLLKLAEQTRETFVFFNNHAEAGAVRGARLLTEILHEVLADGYGKTVQQVESAAPVQESLF